MTRLTERGHIHVEAFCLMKYRSDLGTVEEILWNSRDGVTPFIVRSRDGEIDLQHVDWKRDVYAPDHVPKPGDRVFVTITPALARHHAERLVEKYWDHSEYPMRDKFPDKATAITECTAANLEGDGQPTVVIVTPDGWPSVKP